MKENLKIGIICFVILIGWLLLGYYFNNKECQKLRLLHPERSLITHIINGCGYWEKVGNGNFFRAAEGIPEL